MLIAEVSKSVLRYDVESRAIVVGFHLEWYTADSARFQRRFVTGLNPGLAILSPRQNNKCAL